MAYSLGILAWLRTTSPVLGERYGERQHVLANGGSTLESVDSATLYPITDPNTIFNDLRGEARADAYNTARDNAIRTTRHLLATGRMSFVETYWEDPLLTRELAKRMPSHETIPKYLFKMRYFLFGLWVRDRQSRVNARVKIRTKSALTKDCLREY